MKRLVVCVVLTTAVACGDDHDTNRAPSIEALTLTTVEDTALTIRPEQLIPVDPDRDILSITFGEPEHGTIAGLREWVYSPAPDFNGTDHVTATVTDGALSATATVTIEVTAVNDAPMARDDSFATAEDIRLQVASATLLANDSDPDSFGLSLTEVGAAVDGTVALVGSMVVFTPRADFVGSAHFTYTITDGFLTSTATVVVEVGGANNPPVAVDDAFTIDEDQSLVLSGSQLVGNDTNPEGMTLEVVSVQNARNGSALLDGTTVMFLPEPDFHGIASFEYLVRDGIATDTGLVAVTVTPINDAPVATGDTATTSEDTPVAITVATLLANDTDIDGDTLTVRDVGDAVGGTVVLSGGVATFTPSPDFSGSGSFTYTAFDGTAAATATVAVTVTPTNDGPVAVDDAVTGTEDVVVTIAAVDLLANDSDAEGDPLVIESVGPAVNGAVAMSGGTVTFTPAANTLTGSFPYVVTDGMASATATVSITLAPVNDPPVATADAATTAEDTPVTISLADLLDDDIDIDGDVLALMAVQNADHGQVEIVAGGVLYTPEEDFDGTATFEYVVTDGMLPAVGVVTVTVTPVNDPPIAVDDDQPTREDTPVDIAAFVLLSNDHDPEGDDLFVAAVRDPDHGSVVLAGGVVTFTPEPDFSGDAGFVYDLSDGRLTAAASVVIHVAPVDDPPVAAADRVMTREDSPAVIAAAALLGNDADPEGDALTLTAVRSPVHGVVALAAGTVTFTPEADFHGDASFEYVVAGSSATAVGVVTVVVSPVNDAPIAVADALATAEDTPLTVPLSAILGNDRDVDGDVLGLVILQSEVHGTAVRAGNQITFTPEANFAGIAGFEYIITDTAATAVGQVTVTVTAVNDAPIAASGSATAFSGGSVPIQLAATDAEGSALTYTIVAPPTHGTLTGAPPALTYTPAPGYVGPDALTFRASDGEAESAVATVTLTVRQPVCGNGAVEGAEQCDDGDLDNGDGCDRNCTPTGCGNGEVGGFAASSVTLVWLGTTCENTPGEIRFRIGGQIVHRETLSPFCDCSDPITTVALTDPTTLALLDGPTSIAVEVTGASNYLGWAVAVVEPGGRPRELVLFDSGGGGNAEARTPVLCDQGYEPEVVQSVATTFIEDCDDGNLVDEDGCSAACLVEDCGDGVLQPGLGEECDDGNEVSGDGCQADCTLP